MKEYTMEDAYQDSLLKWEFLSEHDFENQDKGNICLLEAFPRLSELHNFCGFCQYNMEPIGKLNCKDCILSGNIVTCCEKRYGKWHDTPKKHHARDVLNFIKEKYSEYVISNTKKEEEKPRDLLHDFGKEHNADIHDDYLLFSSKDVIAGTDRLAIKLMRNGKFLFGYINFSNNFILSNAICQTNYYISEIDWLTHTLAIISEYVP